VYAVEIHSLKGEPVATKCAIHNEKIAGSEKLTCRVEKACLDAMEADY
jgi:hypothetical protein